MIEAVIFDWAGTTVDYGNMAPVASFEQAFAEHQIRVTSDEIRKPMGLLKIDHIKTMLAMPRIYDTFCEVYGRSYEEKDIQSIYAVFEKHLLSNIARFTDLKPYVLDTMRQLRVMGLKIGSTTGYTDQMMKTVVEMAKQQGYEPDAWYSPDAVGGKGRPYPYMIFKNMVTLGLKDVHNIVKVGDTISDIQEGKHAGVFTIGVIEGSSLMGYSQEEFENLSESSKVSEIKRCEDAYANAGADASIRNLQDLVPLIKTLNKKVK